MTEPAEHLAAPRGNTDWISCSAAQPIPLEQQGFPTQRPEKQRPAPTPALRARFDRLRVAAAAALLSRPAYAAAESLLDLADLTAAAASKTRKKDKEEEDKDKEKAESGRSDGRTQREFDDSRSSVFTGLRYNVEVHWTPSASMPETKRCRWRESTLFCTASRTP